MEILIQPTFNNLREDLGYDDYEDVDEEALLFQQGFDGTPIAVEDGEKFEIPKGYIGSIIDDKVYYLKTEIDEGVWDKEELYGDLEAGSYILNDNVINVISVVYNDNKLELLIAIVGKKYANHYAYIAQNYEANYQIKMLEQLGYI